MRHTANPGLRALTASVLAIGLAFAAACEGDNVFDTGQDPTGGDTGDDTRAAQIFIPPPDSALLAWDLCDTSVDPPQGLCTLPDLMEENEEGDRFFPVEEGTGVSVSDSIQVAFQVVDNQGIAQVTVEGVARRGDPATGTDEEVVRFESKTVEFEDAPRDTIIRRFLNQTGEEREPVFIVVTATDVNGNVSTSEIEILIGGPSVRFVNLPSTALVGRTFPVDIEVTDAEAVSEVVLEVTGDIQRTEVHDTDPLPAAAATIRFEFDIPADVAGGQMQLQAIATNSAGLDASTPVFTVDLIEESASDDLPPELRVTLDADSLLELSDVLTIQVTGGDDPQGQGIETVGYTLESINLTTGDTIYLSESVTLADNPVTADQTFQVTVGDLNVNEASLPDTMTFRVVGWMVDAAQDPHCAASDGTDSESNLESLTCGTLAGEIWAVDLNGDRLLGLEAAERIIVSGRSIVLPNEDAEIADAVVDPVRRSVVFSNQTDDQLEIFDLETLAFGTPILVGSEPWGLFFDRADPDILYVGNSGGTNISVVDVPAGAELISQRILTPNSLLWEVEWSLNDGVIQQALTWFDFSDRPQFIAQDANLNLVYSTVPTGSAPDGTIRLADLNQDVVEVVLYTEHSELDDTDNTTVIWRTDAVSVGASCVTVTDRVYGTTNQVSDTECGEFAADFAAEDVAALGSDTRWASPASWDIGSVGLTDTTFLAASGDGSRVAIGEGATAPTGRIMTYEAATQSVSGAIQVQDLVGNADERVFGVDLNYDGSFGVARGEQAVYFYTPGDLRLQGSPAVEPGGVGAVFHPLHTDGPLNTNVNVSVAFVGTGEATIDVYETRHFSRIGQVTIRDNLVGQLRATLPFPNDNDGLSCPTLPIADGGVTIGDAVRVFSDAAGTTLNDATDDACTVVKLVGVTDAGGVVVVDVRKGDLTRFHPDRQ